jgi:16S rRNA (cytosine1402-N4)-methyltransferase
MPAEMLDALRPAAGMTIVDCTLGRGGHAAAIAERLGSGGTLIGLDVDPKNLDYARQRLSAAPCRARLFHANFAQIEDVLAEVGIEKVDGVLADLGLSTNQFLDPAYGMSFSAEGPLDMRIDRRLRRSAADIVNRTGERELADLIYQLSDERFSRRIARKIVEARAISPIQTTRQLADLVRSAVPLPRRGGAGRAGGKPAGSAAAKAAAAERIDPATRTFMALRMAVNAETDNLDRLLQVAPTRLKPGGRIAVISFHSVEDRAVKLAFRSAERTGLLAILTKKPLTPSDEEIAKNPRSRSAKMRAAERI